MGKLDAILYACLVTGYNSKNISSITVSNNVATVTTSTTHGYAVYDIIAISGANESVFNNEFTIASVPTTTTFTFSVTTGLSSASGSMTCKIAPLGWTREFTGTNKSVYRASDVTSNRMYLRADDSATYYTQVNMYESMSSVDAGSGKGVDTWWCKSNLNTSATCGWCLVGDSKRFYLMTNFYPSSYPNSWSIYVFGDIIPFRSNDPWCCILGGHNVNTAYSSTADSNTFMQNCSGSSGGMFFARNYTYLGGNAAFYLYAAQRWSIHGMTNSPQTIPYPSPVDNAVHLLPVYVSDNGLTAGAWRGILPGFYVPIEAVNGVFAIKDRSVVYNGRTYMAFRSSAGSSCGNYWIDITGPWT